MAALVTEHQNTEQRFPVPYRSLFTEPFEPGQILCVKGKTAEDSVRFTINLHNAAPDFSGHDVPLHLSFRFDEGKIVFNTFSKGEWGKEERKGNPYKKGEDVDVRIRAHDNKFSIYVDQKEIKEYEHRIPLSTVTHFSIDGDITLTNIQWGGKYYPIPFESGLGGDGLKAGQSLMISGVPEKKGKRFHVNILRRNGDIALHFNPRFDEKTVVRNCLTNGKWQTEDREGKMPLEKGIIFDLEIRNDESNFKVSFN
uniref:Galectin n=1 Tax=Syphacia muris TaxID=451379 RepID=A0A158R4D5_9BILA